MSNKILQDVPDNLNEEYYQVNQDILDSFNKFRPPLNLFKFREDVARIETYYKTGDRLTKEQVEEVAQLTKEGFLFVSRQDHPVYVKHIAHQLDLVLVDKNLKPNEISDIFIHALTMRLEHFFEQPVRAIFDRLREDILVLTQYLSEDVYRIRGLIKRMHTEHSLANHSVNCGIMGLNLFARLQEDDFQKGNLPRKTFDNVAIGLFIHDLGMTKIPGFIRDKSKPLSKDEQNKILQHPNVGYEMLTKLDLRFNEIEKCVTEHHERINGSGYPQRMKGNDISFMGRLCGVVDSYCAMITNRVYTPAMDPMDAATALAEDEKRYDPRITRLLRSLLAMGKL